MSQDCNNNCETCENRTKENLFEKQHELSNVKKIIGIISGKGGVGKSLVTALCAVLSQRQGYKTAILDADITGPSIPKMFGLKEKVQGNDMGLFPVKSKTGIEIMSLNLLTENETDPVVWRGPIIASTVKQFWTDVMWGDVDFMFIDMPPGTGDVPLTVFQSIPVNSIIVVTSPQELVSMIVQKALNMANMMNIPISGLVENMSYVECPDCSKKIKVFGESNIEKISTKNNIDILGKIPLNQKLALASDRGMIELFDGNWLNNIVEKLNEV